MVVLVGSGVGLTSCAGGGGQSATSSTTTGSTPSSSTTTTATSATMSPTPVNASVVQACESDAKVFETTLEAYMVQVGSSPPAGNGKVMVGQYLAQLPTSRYYTIWTDGHGGVFVYPPTQTTTPTSFSSSDNFDTGRPCQSLTY